MQPSISHDRWRIGLNAHLLSGQSGYRRAGIHQYIAGLINHLPDDPRFQYTIFTNSQADLKGKLTDRTTATSWPTESPLIRIAWEQLAWPLAAKRGKFHLLHALAFVTPLASKIPVVVTVYDLSFLHYPGGFPTLKRLYLKGQTGRSCRSASRVITISEASRQDIAANYDVPLERIAVIEPGVRELFHPLPQSEVADFRQRQGLPARFFLHVGSLQPRKNLLVLLEALSRLGRSDVEVALVGGKGWHFDEIFRRVEELGLVGQVRFAGYVSDGELPFWYNAATGLVFPSLYEGFGMPVAQAMACGTPVISSNASSMPEVVGTAGLLFEPTDIGALANHMATVLDDPLVAATMRENGLDQARRFSWTRAGQAMLAIYEQVLDGE